MLNGCTTNKEHLINTAEQAVLNGLCLETSNFTKTVSTFTNLPVYLSGTASADRLYLAITLHISRMDLILLKQADASV
jgi:hypothetical protein